MWIGGWHGTKQHLEEARGRKRGSQAESISLPYLERAPVHVLSFSNVQTTMSTEGSRPDSPILTAVSNLES